MPHIIVAAPGRLNDILARDKSLDAKAGDLRALERPTEAYGFD